MYIVSIILFIALFVMVILYKGVHVHVYKDAIPDVKKVNLDDIPDPVNLDEADEERKIRKEFDNG